jgi:mono/diheme cytochrome c family protein
MASTKKEASYVGDVKPFLTKYCLECHNQGKAKAGYNVETFADLMRGGKKGPMVVPEKPSESRLILTLQGKGKPMPPKKSPQPTAEEIAGVSEWIKAGARNDSASDDHEKTR